MANKRKMLDIVMLIYLAFFICGSFVFIPPDLNILIFLFVVVFYWMLRRKWMRQEKIQPRIYIGHQPIK